MQLMLGIEDLWLVYKFKNKLTIIRRRQYLSLEMHDRLLRILNETQEYASKELLLGSRVPGLEGGMSYKQVVQLNAVYLQKQRWQSKRVFIYHIYLVSNVANRKRPKPAAVIALYQA